MSYWEIGYAAMAVTTLAILFVQIMRLALQDEGERVGVIIGTIFLALILAVSVSLIWPILHVLLLCGAFTGGTKRRVEVKS